MRMHLLVVTVLLVEMSSAQATSLPDPRTSAEARQAISNATGQSLQGNAGGALATLKAVAAPEFMGNDAAYRACMLDRFGSTTRKQDDGDTSIDPWAAKVLTAYRSYWRDSLLNPAHRERLTARLLLDLNAIVGAQAKDFDALEPVVKDGFVRRNLHALLGQTGVLRELMLWRAERVQTYHVSLPEEIHDTTVHLLDDFLSLGWGDFATCGRRGTGGWATDDALYAVVPRYPSLESEEFRVTFLGHESQHFADITRFHDLEPWVLEYRAKLTELAQASETRGPVLMKFSEDQGDDTGSPHSFANRKVLSALRARLHVAADADLSALPLTQLQAAARDVLVEDSKQRAGQATSRERTP